MLTDVVKAFEKQYHKYKDNYITDDYTPVDGEYVIVKPLEDGFEILDRVIIKQDKKTKEIDRTNQYIDFICNADYMSKYLESNKAISDKNIYSNNYLTFFVKKENITNGKITNQVIEKYYDVFKNPYIKYEEPKAKKLYEEIEKKNGKSDIKTIEKIEEWVKNNIYSLVPKDSKDKTYLKIFFYYDLEIYRKESEKYILTNIYNTIDYNITIKDQIYGLPNDNMGLNSKKPYLKNKTRKTKVPYLLSQQQVLLQKKFFDYLMNQVSKGKTNVYINEDGIKALRSDEIPEKDFKGYYIRIKKGKNEAEIHDFDTVDYVVNISPMEVYNVLQIEDSRIEYTTIYSIKKMKDIINQVFFNKFLTSNYFTKPKDLRINDNCLKRNLLLSRNALFTWFYKGNKSSVWKVLNQCSFDLIKGSINKGYLLKASEQFNLRCSLKKYFEGDGLMPDVLMDIKNKLRIKINKENTEELESDKEYYFAVGQLASYFISLSKTKNKTHSLANPIINVKNDEKIKNELMKLYKKYNYIIKENKKFKNLYAMVLSYKPEGKVEDDIIVAGYLHSNLIYETEKTNEEVKKGE